MPVRSKSNCPAGSVKVLTNATFVRFEDEVGNPLTSRSVVIRVSATTGDIIGTFSEVYAVAYTKDPRGRRLDSFEVEAKAKAFTPP